MQLFYILVITHFVADFILQGMTIAQNKRGVNKFMLMHAAMMAAAFFLPLINYPAGKVFAATAIVFISHIMIDASRVEVNRFFKLEPSKRTFWMLQGVDQIFHVSVIYITLTYLLI